MDLDERRKHRLDERRRHRLDEFAPEFNRRVDTMDVVDALGPLLPDSARQAIKCELDRKGTICANRELSKRVRSRDGWFEKLIAALKKCGGVDDLVEKLVTDEKGSLMPKHVNMKSPEIDAGPSFEETRFIAETSFPNKEQALEEQAAQLTKCSTSAHTRSDSSIKELASARNYQHTKTLQNTTSHPEKMISQDRCEDVTQLSSDKSTLTQTSFPNKEQALEEQVTQLRKFAATSQNRPGTSKELASTRNYQEKGTLENITSRKDRKEVKSQTDDMIQSYCNKEEVCREQGNSEAVDFNSQTVCKELITSSIDEKEEDESANDVTLEPSVTADEPQEIDKSKDLGVINGVKKQNLNDNIINAGQQSDSTSPMHGMTTYAKFAGRDVDPQSALEDMRKCPQNGQRSFETERQREEIHERSTICIPNEYNGQKGIDMGREVKNLCQVDPVLNKPEGITSDALETDDDTELRFFNKEQKYFSKAGEHEKAILKELHLLTPTGERNLTKIKELGITSEAGNSGDSYQPLRSNDNPSSHNPPSSREFSLLVSETSEGEALYAYHPNIGRTVLKKEHACMASSGVVSKVVTSGGEETSKNNAEFTVQNHTIFRKETEKMEDSHSVERNNVCVQSTLVSHEHQMPIKDANDKVVNGINIISEIPAVSEKDAEGYLGRQNLIDSILPKAGGCKEGENETEAIKQKVEAPPLLEELRNVEHKISIENLSYNEINEMGSSGIDEIRVKQKILESVNDKKGDSNDKENDRKAGVISWNPTELRESEMQTGIGIQYRKEVSNSNTNLESSLEDENRQVSSTHLSNGVIGKTVTVIGSLAAMMFGGRT